MKPKLILVGVGAALVITAVWYFALWSPKGEDLDKAKADLAAQEQRASELTARLTRLKKLEANADVLERDRALLATAIPTADELDTFLLQVNERSARAGVQLVNIAPQQPARALPREARHPSSCRCRSPATTSPSCGSSSSCVTENAS